MLELPGNARDTRPRVVQPTECVDEPALEGVVQKDQSSGVAPATATP